MRRNPRPVPGAPAGRHCRRLLASAWGAALLAGAVACGGDDGTTTTVVAGVEVTDPGATDGRVQLGVSHVGDAAETSTSLAIDLALDVPGQAPTDTSVALTVRSATEVIAVADDGGRTVHEVVHGITLDQAPEGADAEEIEADYAALADVVFENDYDANGIPVSSRVVDEASLAPDARTVAGEIQESASTATVYYPTEPVGVGATWTATQTTSKQGFEMMVTYQYELTSLVGDEYTIAIDYHDDIDQEVESEGTTFDTTGSISGSGTATGSLSNPLLQSVQADQTLQLDLEADGETLTLEAGYRVEVTAS